MLLTKGLAQILRTSRPPTAIAAPRCTREPQEIHLLLLPLRAPLGRRGVSGLQSLRKDSHPNLQKGPLTAQLLRRPGVRQLPMIFLEQHLQMMLIIARRTLHLRVLPQYVVDDLLPEQGLFTQLSVQSPSAFPHPIFLPYALKDFGMNMASTLKKDTADWTVMQVLGNS